MSTLITLLHEAKARGNGYIYAPNHIMAEKGMEWLLRNGYLTTTLEDAEYNIALYARYDNGIIPCNMGAWIWSIKEEIANKINL